MICAAPGWGITVAVEPLVDVPGRDPECAGGGDEMLLIDPGVSCEGEVRSMETLVPFCVL